MQSIEIYSDAISLAANTANKIVNNAVQAIKNKGVFSIALAGGSTPRGVYRLLASEQYEDQIDWDRVHVFWGDERSVPPEDADSNHLLARQTLLDHILIPSENIHRIKAELPPENAAADYERDLINFFKLSGGGTPRFDLVLLGLGEDGHTASLFPNTAALTIDQQLVVANKVDKLDSWRITFTPRLINSAAKVFFLVSGEIKSEILQLVLEGEFQPNLYPAQLIKPTNGKLQWLVDQQAASRLKK